MVLDSVGVAVDDLEFLLEGENVALLVLDKERREDPLRVGELDPVLLMDALLVAVRLEVVVREVVEVEVPVRVDIIEVLLRLLAVDDFEVTEVRVLINDAKGDLVAKEDLVGKIVPSEDRVDLEVYVDVRVLFAVNVGIIVSNKSNLEYCVKINCGTSLAPTAATVADSSVPAAKTKEIADSPDSLDIPASPTSPINIARRILIINRLKSRLALCFSASLPSVLLVTRFIQTNKLAFNATTNEFPRVSRCVLIKD